MPASESSGGASKGTAEHIEDVTAPHAGMTYVAGPKVTLTPRALEVLRMQILERVQREIREQEAASQAKEENPRASRRSSRLNSRANSQE
ncbi:hypothetical protein QBC45DRAFT_318858 [Copromyces sp. CBS 386.78]|nr:hypothetical protein QBC45DRAFT_318858 [Copromyces sp. CBS 386.78]